MANTTEQTQNTIILDLDSSLTWDAFGDQLARAIASGNASQAVDDLIGYLENNGNTFGDLLMEFQNQNGMAIQGMEPYLGGGPDESTLQSIVSSLAMAYDGFSAANTLPELAGLNIASAFARNRAENLGLNGFCLFFTALNIRIAISEKIGDLVPPAGYPLSNQQWWAYFRTLSFAQINEGTIFLAEMLSKLSMVASQRVTLSFVNFPPTPPILPGQTGPDLVDPDNWAVYLDGVQYGDVVQGKQNAEAIANQLLTDLQMQYKEQLVNPAERILHDLSKLRTRFFPVLPVVN